MNYYKKILNYLLSIGILVSINFSQDLSIDLILLNTGQFTLNSWNNVSELWKLEIENTDTEKIDYFLKFILKKNNELIVEGHTKPLSINSNESMNESITYDNSDPLFAEHILAYYYEASDFKSNIINNLGYLPSGTYNLELVAVNSETEATISSDDVEIVFTVGDHFSIEEPADGMIFTQASEAPFLWYTPGFRQGVIIEFRFIIAAIVQGESDTPGGAIDYGEANTVYHFDSNWESFFEGVNYPWPWVETGSEQLTSLNLYYSHLLVNPNFKEFICGYDYAWRMEGREIIDGYGDGGIWGWPEAENSVIRTFSWGGSPTGLVSPEGDDVLPIFSWDPIF